MTRNNAPRQTKETAFSQMDAASSAYGSVCVVLVILTACAAIIFLRMTIVGISVVLFIVIVFRYTYKRLLSQKSFDLSFLRFYALYFTDKL